MIPSWREIGSDRGWLQLSQRGGRLDKIGLGSKKRAMSSQVLRPSQYHCQFLG